MSTVKLPLVERFDTKTAVHKSTQNADVSLSQEFQKRLSDASLRYGIVDHGK